MYSEKYLISTESLYECLVLRRSRRHYSSTFCFRQLNGIYPYSAAAAVDEDSLLWFQLGRSIQRLVCSDCCESDPCSLDCRNCRWTEDDVVSRYTEVFRKCSLVGSSLKGYDKSVRDQDLRSLKMLSLVGTNPYTLSPLENEEPLAFATTPLKSCSATCGLFAALSGNIRMNLYPL